MSDALKKEIIGIALLGLFLFLFVSLLSYHPFDPSPQLPRGVRHGEEFLRKGRFLRRGLPRPALRRHELRPVRLHPLFSVLSLRKKAVDHLLLLAAGFVLLFFSLSALLQILVGRMPMKGVTIEVSGLVGFSGCRRSYQCVRLFREPPALRRAFSHIPFPHRPGAPLLHCRRALPVRASKRRAGASPKTRQDRGGEREKEKEKERKREEGGPGVVRFPEGDRPL